MSQEQAVAGISFGLIITGSDPTTAPDPYDVRLGVDNGDGDLGTLTSPLATDVRLGVQYGGDGTQYTGTLYVPGLEGGTSWTEDKLEEWYAESLEWPCTARYQAWTFPCIRNPIKSGFSMQAAGYNQQADTIIDILRTQAVLMGVYNFKIANPQEKRPVFVSDGMSFQVLNMENDDTAQPSVRFMCQKVLAVSAG